jgi:hypothetical protein
MADQLASAIAANVLGKLGSIVWREFGMIVKIEGELKELTDTMTTIEAVLLDAEEKQASNRALSNWIGKLKDIFHEIEEVLDEVEYQVQRKRANDKYGRTIKEVCDFSSRTKAFWSRHFQVVDKIKSIREKLGKIAGEKDQFDLTAARVEDRRVIDTRREMTHSFVPPSDVIGRNNYKENIISDLLREPNGNQNVNVIRIDGIGGLGKTTVAKLVYDDECVAHHFELRMWVCVSEDFDVPRLIREILMESGVRIDENSRPRNRLQTKMREKLKNKRFLLVLDDVWNEDRNKWNELKDLLLGGAKGSKILVTTRTNKVASIMSTVSSYTLEGLSEKDSLSLFIKYAFNEGEDKQYPNLLEIGKEIVKKCKGVPLAIRTLGSLLFSKVNEREWKFVRDNEIWRLEQKEGDILPALQLSYDPMPSHLKQCFSFCSLFPKNYLFDSGKLIAFWMAHGLLNKKPNTQDGELEDVGDMYFKELWSRSFFQDVEKDFWNNGYQFKMHDLVHDLALKVAEEVCSAYDFQKKCAKTVRHLSFSHDGRQVPSFFDTISSDVRTTLFQTKQQELILVEKCILRFKCLRVLCLSDSCFEVLSSSIGNLQHLRYLSLAGNEKIKKLPNSICKLYNLQTLLLHGCSRLERLPKDTRKMISLRHLTVTTTNVFLFENGENCLNSLQFLLISRCPRLENLFQRMEKSLANLRTLIISGCESLTSLNLDVKCLTALEALVIEDCKVLTLQKERHVLPFLTGTEDDRDLKFKIRKLKIYNLPELESLPPWLEGSANTLQFLSISFCENFMALPEAEWGSDLKSLEIIGCPKLSSLPKDRLDHCTKRIDDRILS